MFTKIAILLAGAASVNAACDNQCSGHGSCMIDDVCECHDNWGVGLSLDSGDCSDRVCPFEIAWVDDPNSAGRFHKYAECSGKGVCNRGSGLCECFDGYEGKACKRTECPNDCSGHGTCEYIEDLAYGVTWNEYSSDEAKFYPKEIPYFSWDRSKARACVCDAQYTALDCSKRMCPHGNDILAVHDNLLSSAKHQQQSIVLKDFDGIDYSADQEGSTFALKFTSRLNESFVTTPIKFDYSTNSYDLGQDVHNALLSLPQQVIDGVGVVVTRNAADLTITLTFSGDAVQGTQNLVEVLADECLDGCTPKLTGIPLETRTSYGSRTFSTIGQSTASELNSYECGRRGKCDYETGLCGCFEGYTGENCNTQTTLV